MQQTGVACQCPLPVQASVVVTEHRRRKVLPFPHNVLKRKRGKVHGTERMLKPNVSRSETDHFDAPELLFPAHPLKYRVVNHFFSHPSNSTNP
jgi:hypothetical protein